MKIKFVLSLALLVIATEGFSQFSFGVSPGISFNSAYFGYKINNKLVPFIGFQYVGVKLKLEESGRRFDFDINQIISYSERDEYSASIAVPNIGVKYFIKQQNKIHAYLLLSFSKPILNAKVTNNDIDDDDFKEDIKNISMWGSELGFGIEYFFDDNFSIGGEFGLRTFHFKSSTSRTSTIFDPNTGNTENVEIKNEYRFNLSPTYSRISLNFYF